MSNGDLVWLCVSVQSERKLQVTQASRWEMGVKQKFGLMFGVIMYHNWVICRAVEHGCK